MSDERDRFYREVPVGRAGNVAGIAKRLDLSADDALALGEGLVADGRCEWTGTTKRRISRRVASALATSTPTDASPSVLPASLSALARKLWDALPPGGEQITNVDIRSRDTFSEVDGTELQAARHDLKTHGLVQLRAGRDGGGLRRLVEESESEREPAIIEDALAEPALERLEHELYEPFRDWLIQELDTDTFVFAEAAVTARARRQGRWRQPDVCQLTVTNFEWVPGATVELSSFELKRRADVRKLEAVYEAAAHGRFAHRANLVLEVTDASR